MNESELYKELGLLTRNKDKWEESIPYVGDLLSYESVKIQAKAIWLLGEMGLAYPASVYDYVSLIAPFLDSDIPLLRERAVNALGRIGRGHFQLVEPHWKGLFRFAEDEDSKVRLSFILLGHQRTSPLIPLISMSAICQCLRLCYMTKMIR